MYKEHFGLRDNPFSITPDPRYVYMSPHHREGLGHLLYGTGEDGGFVQITGEVGTGKTTLIRTLLEQDIPEVDVALILNPRLTVNEFLAAVCDELRVPIPQPQASLKQLVDALNTHLLNTHAAGRRTVIIVDEAQHLQRDVLEQVRLLTNLETHRHKLLRIMLVGQPELREMLARQDMRQLAQRITARYHLDSLSRQQTRDYVLHRLKVAGGSERLFTGSALRDVYRLTRGTPRLINIICDRALLGAYSQGRSQVNRAILRHAAQEVLAQADHQAPADRAGLASWLAMAVGSVALGTSLFLGRPYLDQYLAHRGNEAVNPVAVAEAEPETPAFAEAPAETSTPVVAPEPTEPVQPGVDESTARRQLAALWGAEPAAGNDLQCLDLHTRGLHCLSDRGNWAELRGYNLPAMLALGEGGDQSWVVVRRLYDGEVQILTDDGELSLSLGELSEQWSGAYMVIWRSPVRATQIGPESEQSAIRWLLKRLDMAEASDAGIVSLPYRYDSAIRERVRRFQESRGLQADGLVGPRTMIHLNSLAPEPGSPVLVTTAGAE